MTLHWTPIFPLWLVAAIVAVLAALLGYGCVVLVRKRVPPRWIARLGALRVVILAVLVVCLLRPVIHTDSSRTDAQDLVVLIDTSGSMAGKTIPAFERFRREMSDRFNVRWYAVDERAQALDDAALDRLAFTGRTTDLASGLASALELDRLDAAASSPNRRVVLISDGLDQGELDPAEIALQNFVSIDVLPPQPAAVAPGADVVAPRIASLQAPQRVRLGGQLRLVAAVVAPPHDQPRTFTAQLLEDGQPVHAVRFTLDAGQSVVSFTLDHHPQQVGPRHYAIRLVEEGNEAGGQTSRSVNVAEDVDAVSSDSASAASVVVHVVSQQIEVLMLEGAWRWSYRFTRRVIEDDPTLNLTSFLARGDRSWVQFTEPEQQSAVIGMPQTVSALAGFDVIVLGEVEPRRLPAPLLQSIRYLVSQHGKSLVVIASPQIHRLASTPQIASLLPVELDARAAVPIAGPMEVRVSDDAGSDPTFFRPDDPHSAFWRRVPPIEHVYAPLRKKPGATVLLETTELRNPFGPIIVAAVQPVGRGRVLYVGTDTLWKWQMFGPQVDAGLTPYAVFWQQVLRAMTPAQTRSQTAQLDLTLSRSVARAAQPVQLVASLSIDDQADATPELRGWVQFADESTLPLVLVADAQSPGEYRAQFLPTTPGLCTVRVVAELEGRTLAEAQSAIDVLPPAPESADPGVDTAYLARLASDTAGRWLDPADPSTWPAPDADPRPVVERAQISLWHNFFLPVLLAVLLGIDWLVRLIRGYA